MEHLTDSLSALDAWPSAKQSLASRFQPILDHARASHPQIVLDPSSFAAHIAGHFAAALDQAKAADSWLDNLLIEDLYLALGCAKGDAVALMSFEQTYGEQLLGLAHRHENEVIKAADLLQLLRQKLFVGSFEHRTPKILDFAGQGALRSWLQITAVRAYIDATRSANSRTKSEDLVQGDYFDRVLDDAQDLELDFLKNAYKVAFKEAFAQAVASLTPRQRNLLGQSVVAGLSIDQIGAIYGVHRATAARWLQDARQALATQTHKSMIQRLEIDASELDSIMNLIQSRASVSMSRLFSPTASSSPDDRDEP